MPADFESSSINSVPSRSIESSETEDAKQEGLMLGKQYADGIREHLGVAPEVTQGQSYSFLHVVKNAVKPSGGFSTHNRISHRPTVRMEQSFGKAQREGNAAEADSLREAIADQVEHFTDDIKSLHSKSGGESFGSLSAEQEQKYKELHELDAVANLEPPEIRQALWKILLTEGDGSMSDVFDSSLATQIRESKDTPPGKVIEARKQEAMEDMRSGEVKRWYAMREFVAQTYGEEFDKKEIQQLIRIWSGIEDEAMISQLGLEDKKDVPTEEQATNWLRDQFDASDSELGDDMVVANLESMYRAKDAFGVAETLLENRYRESLNE